MRRLSVLGAWAVAAVFALHPMHVESVAWIMGRKDLLSGLFCMAVALCWIRSIDGLGQARAGPLASSACLKLVWPADLAVIYPLWDIDIADLLAWGYLVAAVAVASLLWFGRLRLGRGRLAGSCP